MIYLISGDDETKHGAWRSRLRRRAEASNGPGALEAFDAATCPPDVVAAALAAMTLDAGERYIVVDGVESWKAADLEPLERALAAPPDDTILLMLARGRAPKRLVKAVASANGEQRDYEAPKAWQLPRWASECAAELGLTLDKEAARAVVALVGNRQQRIAREVEKLALLGHPRKSLSADDIRELASAERTEQAYTLADAIVAGDAHAALAIAERLTSAGEPPSKLMFAIVRRLRDVHRLAELLDAGVSESKTQGQLQMAPWVWKRALAQAKKADRDVLAQAIGEFAELEVELRGGGTGLDEATAFSLTLVRACGGRAAAAA